jgi:hypothetical protein
MTLGITKRKSIFKQPDTTNSAGGKSFGVSDLSQRLLHIVGAPGFNEPRSFYKIPETKNPLESRAFKNSFDSLTGNAKEIVTAAIELAQSSNARDLLAIAHWLRREGHCRQTPLILLAVAAHVENSREFVRAYAPAIIQRADELVGAYAAYRYLFGKPIPSALLKGVRDSFGKFSEYQLIKYNQPGKTPSLKDVILQMPDRKPGKPVSRGMAEFLLNGTLVDRHGVDHSESAPLASAYLKFLEAAKHSNSFDDHMQELAENAQATWENVISLFGGSQKTWTSVFPRMGYMAVLRNIRNMIQAGVPAGEIAARIADEKSVLRSKQFPFRFVAASNEISHMGDIDIKSRQVILDALSVALEFSVKNVGTIPGDSIIMADCSGSMLSRIAGKSKMNCKTVAATLAAILAKACESPFVYAFGSEMELLDIRKTDSVSSIIEKILSAQVGGATYAYKPFYHAVENGLKADRIVLLSDMQCYGKTPYFYSDYQRRIGADLSVSTGLRDYKNKINRDVWVHSVNLNAHDSSAQIAGDEKNVNMVSGFSDKILSLFLEAEGATEIPTLDYIRENF